MVKFFPHLDCFVASLEKPIGYNRYLPFQAKARKDRKESILFLEHLPTLTSGTNAKWENLLLSAQELESRGIAQIPLPRGGDFTAHEPGQIVGYLHWDLRKRQETLGGFLKQLEFALVESIRATWNISVLPHRQAPGLYFQSESGPKLVSLGIYAKSFFTSFGFALNATNSLETFQWIHPCGIPADRMTSLSRLGLVRDIAQEKRDFISSFLHFFFKGEMEKPPKE